MRTIGWILVVWGFGVVIYAYQFNVAVPSLADYPLGIASQPIANTDLMETRAMIHLAGWAQQIMGVILIAASYLRETVAGSEKSPAP